jgi:hypothetical protein
LALPLELFSLGLSSCPSELSYSACQAHQALYSQPRLEAHTRFPSGPSSLLDKRILRLYQCLVIMPAISVGSLLTVCIRLPCLRSLLGFLQMVTQAERQSLFLPHSGPMTSFLNAPFSDLPAHVKGQGAETRRLIDGEVRLIYGCVRNICSGLPGN